MQSIVWHNLHQGRELDDLTLLTYANGACIHLWTNTQKIHLIQATRCSIFLLVDTKTISNQNLAIIFFSYPLPATW